MIDGSVLQSAQTCFEKKGRVVVKMVVIANLQEHYPVFRLLSFFLETLFHYSLNTDWRFSIFNYGFNYTGAEK